MMSPGPGLDGGPGNGVSRKRKCGSTRRGGEGRSGGGRSGDGEDILSGCILAVLSLGSGMLLEYMGALLVLGDRRMLMVISQALAKVCNI